jgi:hypothetical protein
MKPMAGAALGIRILDPRTMNGLNERLAAIVCHLHLLVMAGPFPAIPIEWFGVLEPRCPAQACTRARASAARVAGHDEVMSARKNMVAEGTHTDRVINLKSQGYRQCGFAAITHRYTQQNALSGSMP